jgi:hypothetical protein
MTKVIGQNATRNIEMCAKQHAFQSQIPCLRRKIERPSCDQFVRPRNSAIALLTNTAQAEKENTLQLTIEQHGLKIRLTAEDGWAPHKQFRPGGLAEFIQTGIEIDGNEVSTLRDIFEPYWTNNGFEPFDAGQANPFVGLTEAPCIAEHALIRADDGRQSIQPGDRVWWYPDYGIRNPLDVLLDRGEVEFVFGFISENGGCTSC